MPEHNNSFYLPEKQKYIPNKENNMKKNNINNGASYMSSNSFSKSQLNLNANKNNQDEVKRVVNSVDTQSLFLTEAPIQ